jgi:hypothetical protein
MGMSDNVHDDVLKRLEAGEIDADEAGRLLAETESAAQAAAPARPAGLPDMDHFRRNWQPGFAGAVVTLLVSGRLIGMTRKHRGLLGGLVRLVAWPLALLSGLAALISYAGRNSPWAHIRIEDHDGTRITLDVPVPLAWISRLLNGVRPWVDGEAAEQIDLAVETLEALQDEIVHGHQPLTIDVNDEGDRVQVYFG